MSRTGPRTLDVEQACAVLRDERAAATGVLTMSAIAYWGEPRPQDFRLLGTMGAAGSIGLGLALGAPDRRVWIVDGDGSLLMQLGVIAAIADAAPPNLLHLVLDNGIYAVSGAQPTPAPRDWAALLLAAGYAGAATATTPDELRAALRATGPGPRGIVVRCRPERPAYPEGWLAIDSRAEVARVRATFAGG